MKRALTPFIFVFFAVFVPFLFSQQHEVPKSHGAQENHEARESQDTPESDEPADLAQKRAEWFAQQRGVAPGKLPSGLRAQAVQQLERMRAAEVARKAAIATGVLTPAGATAATANSLSSTPWNAIGPVVLTDGSGVTYSGRITSLAVDPRDALVVYAGASDGGVWKTTNGGQSWTPLTDTQSTLSTGSLALDPSHPDTIYVGTGDTVENYPGIGILKSVDGGTTWTNIQGPFVSGGLGARIGAVAVSPSNSQVVLAAATSSVPNVFTGIFRSGDGGNTWAKVIPAAQAATTVVFDPQNGSVAYAGVVNFGTSGQQVAKLMKSTDGGSTWSATGLPEGEGTRILAVIAPSDDSLFVTYTPATNDRALLFRSRDGGSTFTDLSSASLCMFQCGYNLALAVNPANSNELFFGGLNIVSSSDGGANWDFVRTPHADQHALAYSAAGERLYAGNDGGVWVATDFTSPVGFASLNSNLSTLQFYPGISIAPGNPAFGLGGMQDNGVARYSGSTQWRQLVTGDGFRTAIDPNVPSTFYITIQNGVITKTTDNGATFSPIMVNLVGPAPFQTPITLDALNPSRLYTIRNLQVFQNSDGGDSWHAISPQINTLNGSDIEVSPSDSNTVWTTGCCGGVVVSRNVGAGAGATWNTFQGPSQRPVTAIAISPTDPATAYVVVSGFAAFLKGAEKSSGHVFKVTNGGSTWTDVTSNLPDVPASAIVIDPAVPNTLYLATDVGVFTTPNGGASWDTMVTGLPRSAVLGMALDVPTRTLRAATHGRGMFDMQLPAAGSGSVTASPSSLSFAGQAVGSSSAAQSVVLTNATAGAVSVSNIAATGDFSQTNNCGASLAANSSCTINVTFTPAASGTRSGTLTITDSDSGSPHTVALTGAGSAGGGGSCTLNSTNPSVTICSPANNGTVASPVHIVAGTTDSHTVVSMKIYVDGVVQFTGASNSVDSSLAMASGAHRITVKAWDNAAPQQVFSQSINITVGTAAGAVTVTPTSLTFGNQNVGTSSAAQTVTLSNTTAGAVSISGIAATGDFAQANNCGSSVAANGSCTVSVTFAPAAAGTRSGTLTVTDSAGTQTVSLTGTGTASSGCTLSTVNPSVTICQPGNGASAASPVHIAAGTTDSHTVVSMKIYVDGVVKFTGTSKSLDTSLAMAAGAHHITVKAWDNAAPQQVFAQSVDITVGAVSGSFTVSPSALSFGNQNVGTTSAAQTVTLNNSTASAVSIGSIAASADFAQGNNCGASLAANGSCSVSVTFTPSAAGARSGTLTVTDSAGTQTVSLSGTGVTASGCTLNTTNPSVTICQPGNGAAVSSPVHIVAATNDSHTVVSMKIYVDGVVKFTGTSKSLDTSLAIAAGAHHITVKAWDNASPQQVFSQSIDVTVH